MNKPPFEKKFFPGAWLVILMMLFLQTGCREAPLPPGTVATVNGEPISLHAVQALLDSRSASMGIPPRPSLEDMQRNYGHSLGILIVHTLVRQDLASHDLAVGEKEVEEKIRQVKEDFGTESLEKYLTEAYLREDDWRQLTRDYLALETFRNRILLPAIKIELDEVRKYFQEHQNEFKLPSTVRVCYASSSEKEKLEEWCGQLAEKIVREEPMARCLTTTINEVPPPWDEEIKKQRPFTCARYHQVNEQWQTVALLQKENEKSPPLSDLYALIEKILVEQKQNMAFEAWLERKLGQSVIKVTPELVGYLDFPAHHLHGAKDTEDRETKNSDGASKKAVAD